jgi:pantoate--beta-alanine ligase
MGALHEGHISLIRKSVSAADITVVSIFVNPKQFGQNEDLDKYPRDLDKDLKILAENSVDILFNPSASEIYPADYQTYVEVSGITKRLEGASRPDHFKGVSTIVNMLFNIVNPDIAVFGQKDAQQGAVIRKMVEDLKMGTQILVEPIVREEDGLAMSSRNVYLSEKERRDAAKIYKALRRGLKQIEDGERRAEKITDGIKEIILEAESSRIDYVSIADSAGFSEVSRLLNDSEYYILAACWIGGTRLIDNVKIKI